MAGLDYLVAFGSGLKEGFQEGFEEVGKAQVAFGLIKWFIFIFLLVALGQAYGIWKALGIYLIISFVVGLVRWFAVQDRNLTEPTDEILPVITKDRNETEESVTLTVEEKQTDGTVILGLPGESNIAEHHGTHRELEPGDSVTLTHNTDDDSLVIETETKTETLDASEETEIDVFRHDFLLFEHYENAQPTKQHVNYGDIQ